MNKFIISFVLLFALACTKNNAQTNTTKLIAKIEDVNKQKTKKTIIKNNTLTIKDEDYTLKFTIEKTKDKQPNLIINIKLHKGSSFISPFEEKEFTGKFYMDLGSYKDLSFDGKITETPQAIAIYDNYKNEHVIWVKENTTYTQALTIKSNDDFKVFGRVKFVIEPRCSLETIPFGISYKDGRFQFIDPKC